MCGKAAVSHLSWSEIYDWASSLTPPNEFPADPASRVNISPSRQRRKSDPESMQWEHLPVSWHEQGVDFAGEATWPYLPPWSRGRLPTLSSGKLLSTANARLREDGAPFAPTYMAAWSKDCRLVVWVSWFYEFDSRVHPQIPYAVFPLQQPFWAMAGLGSWYKDADGEKKLSVSIITVNPNEVLKSVGHHRSPALLRSGSEVQTWLTGERSEALELLRPHPDESMGVESVPMNIKIPGNQDVTLPPALTQGQD